MPWIFMVPTENLVSSLPIKRHHDALLPHGLKDAKRCVDACRTEGFTLSKNQPISIGQEIKVRGSNHVKFRVEMIGSSRCPREFLRRKLGRHERKESQRILRCHCANCAGNGTGV